MAFELTKEMLAAGYAAICKEEPMVSNFIDEEDAETILKVVWDAMVAAAPAYEFVKKA